MPKVIWEGCYKVRDACFSATEELCNQLEEGDKYIENDLRTMQSYISAGSEDYANNYVCAEKMNQNNGET